MQSCSQVFWSIGWVLSSTCCSSSHGLSLYFSSKLSLVSSTATLRSRPAVGSIITWQAERADLNWNMIFTPVVHTCALGWKLETRTEDPDEAMNLLHKVETLTKGCNFLLWRKMGVIQPDPERCCGGAPQLLLNSLARLLCAMWSNVTALH